MNHVRLTPSHKPQRSADLCPLPQNKHADDLVEQCLAEIGAIPLLSKAQEQALAERIQAGDAQAKRAFIEANLCLVVHLARQYAAPGRNLLDLIQDGNLGLMRAVEHFDPERGYKFSTYAMYWIKQAIRRGQEQSERLVRLPSYLEGRLGLLARTRAHLFEAWGADPSDEQLAEALSLSLATVTQAQAADYQVLSLDRAISGHDETTLADLIADPAIIPQEEYVCQQEDARQRPGQVQVMLSSPTQREREVIVLYYCLDGLQGQRSYAQVGQMLGLSRERVRQLRERALGKLRQAAGSATLGMRHHEQAS
jgi:RNA polymerase sigma factor (sigma-70 family)